MNFFEIPSEKTEEELVCTLLTAPGFRVERIVSQGHRSPDGFWYDQSEDEWVLVLSGSAVLEVEGTERFLSSGDSLLLPAHQKHRVLETSAEPPCVWLCIFGNQMKTGGVASENTDQTLG